MTTSELTDRIIQSYYWNSNGHAVAIVAIQGYNDDWAAYIGGSDYTEHEIDAKIDIAQYGAKLSSDLAKLLFPSITHLTYRL